MITSLTLQYRITWLQQFQTVMAFIHQKVLAGTRNMNAGCKNAFSQLLQSKQGAKISANEEALSTETLTQEGSAINWPWGKPGTSCELMDIGMLPGLSSHWGSSLVLCVEILKQQVEKQQQPKKHQLTPSRAGQIHEPLMLGKLLSLRSKGITRAQHLSRDAQSLVGSSAG